VEAVKQRKLPTLNMLVRLEKAKQINGNTQGLLTAGTILPGIAFGESNSQVNF